MTQNFLKKLFILWKSYNHSRWAKIINIFLRNLYSLSLYSIHFTVNHYTFYMYFKNKIESHQVNTKVLSLRQFLQVLFYPLKIMINSLIDLNSFVFNDITHKRNKKISNISVRYFCIYRFIYMHFVLIC